MRVLMLCDGGGPIGVGHVIRSLALAEASLAAGHSVVVAGHFEGSFLQGQLTSAPFEVVPLEAPMSDDDLPHLADLLQRVRPDVVHVDSYEAPGRLRELVVSPGLEALVSNMEDGAFGRRSADVVIDPTLGAELSARPGERSTLLLRGSRYIPLRQRVLDARLPVLPALPVLPVADEPPAHAADVPGDNPGAGAGGAARSVLVVMGGTDPVGLAPVAVTLLAGTGLGLDVTVIAAGELAERVRAVARGSRLSLNVLAPVDDLASIMARQDLVVSAAGTSVWELCCIGVPMALVWAVQNQQDGYDRVVAAGAALGLGGPELRGDDLRRHPDAVGLLRAALTDSRTRQALALAGRKVVDGLGAWRVVRTWEQALRLTSSAGSGSPGRPPSGQESSRSSHGLIARQAAMQDARLLRLWRNDPATLAGSRSSQEVRWDDHLGWLADSLTRTDRLLLVVEDGQGPVGTIRWDLTQEGEREWEVSVTVAPDRRGQSLARPLLRAGELALSQATRSSVTEVTAYLAVVNIENEASLRLFETSAYLPDAPPDDRGFMRYRKAAQVA